MSFMEPQVSFGQWIEADSRIFGTKFIPLEVTSLGDFPWPEDGGEVTEDHPEFPRLAEALLDFVGDDLETACLVDGWGARMSAPGYLDATDWCLFESEKEATDYLEAENMRAEDDG